MKIFFFESTKEDNYYNSNGTIFPKNVFNTEYKNGFVMMASCCLLIETLTAFIGGYDKTPGGQGGKSFETVFNKAKEYDNQLKKFSNKKFYEFVRCGILHQGETYRSFKIKRSGEIYDKSTLTINATLFTKELKLFLKSFAEELKTRRWDGELWDNCRVKLRYIVNNSRIN